MTVSGTLPDAIPVSECWRLLRGAPVGRLAAVSRGMPEIFPVNHAVDHASILFRTDMGTKLWAAVNQDVAYEVDGYDAADATAWSVVVKGRAREVWQKDETLAALPLPLAPWHPGPKPRLVRIHPVLVTGRRFHVPGGFVAGSAGDQPE